MNAIYLVVFAFAIYFIGYRYYSAYLSKKVFKLRHDELMPSLEHEDGIDFVPTRKHILFGHHFTSIAGVGPIVGPAIAVIWGWLPAFIWVVFGTLFIGAVHDFGCLAISIRYHGHSIGDITAKVIGPRSRMLFLIIIFFLVWLVIAVFANVIANLFIDYPASVIPINFEIIVAICIGLFIYKGKGKLLVPSLIALGLLYVSIFVGMKFPLHMPALFINESQTWIIILLGYSFIASTLPVWILLQPRDFINSHQLFLALGALYVSIFIFQPTIVAPALQLSAKGAPPWFPFLFITIACGAISGFHGLVSSGTTSKQIMHAKDARLIGYGSMIGESLLGLMAVLATTAGFASFFQWQTHYASWQTAGKLGSKINAFVNGGAYFLQNGLGIPESFSSIVMAVIIISFAATTLDTAVRIQRYIIQELAKVYRIQFVQNRYVAGFIGAFTPLILLIGGKHWIHLWPIFGASNQLLGSLSLLVISVYLFKRKSNGYVTLVPMIFLSLITFSSMIMNAIQFLNQKNWLLTGVSTIMIALALWILFEGVLTLRSLKSKTSQA